MKLSLHVPEFWWEDVYTIRQGLFLEKGRHGQYSGIMDATKLVLDKYGCYSWCRGGIVSYCGSFSQDYISGKFKTNLQARVHNYLQNHRIRNSTGQKNTNLIVFENINRALVNDDVTLRIFRFDSLQIGETRVSHFDYSLNADLVHSVEQLLICCYRRIGECAWNRT
jgi:hypothetical protein